MKTFPYLSEPDEPSWHLRARAEGRVLEMNWVDKLLYVWKYLFSHKLSAPADIMEHFKSVNLTQIKQPALGVRLGFFGDLMWIRKNWSGYVSSALHEDLAIFDGLVGNLETVVAKSLPVPEVLPDYFVYNSHPDLVRCLSPKVAALSFANNHVLDQGDGPALETLSFLDKLNIEHSGLSLGGAGTTSFTRGGITFGFHASTFGLNDPRLAEKSKLRLNLVPGLAPETEENVPDLSGPIAALKEMKNADVKILYLHWGYEFEFYPTARQMQVARLLAEAGADIILGSGPHVVQPAEVFALNGYALDVPAANRLTSEDGRARKSIVFYSLGNFANAMFGDHCRIATVAGISFFREAGSVDWSGLKVDYYFNRSSKGGRELVPLAEEIAKRPALARKTPRL